MKKFKLLIAFSALLVITACQTNAMTKVVWKEDGTLSASNGNKIQLDIQSAYDSFTYAGNIYVAGFKIDDEGNNYPYVVAASEDFSSIKYWPFDEIPNDIFVYKQELHLNTTSGHVFALQDGNWVLQQTSFPPRSQVIYSDNMNELIVCYSASLAKADSHKSGCYSTSKKWESEFIWFTQVPKLCNGNLYAIEEKQKGKVFKKISIETGKVIASKAVAKIPDDLCLLNAE
jgi:hypothetical protein